MEDDRFVPVHRHTDAGDERMLHLKGESKLFSFTFLLILSNCAAVFRLLHQGVFSQAFIFLQSPWTSQFNWRTC